jgi:hypothetical protein
MRKTKSKPAKRYSKPRRAKGTPTGVKRTSKPRKSSY